MTDSCEPGAPAGELGHNVVETEYTGVSGTAGVATTFGTSLGFGPDGTDTSTISTAFADEDEFDIEGFRLGMNLLDHFTEQTIHNGDEDYYKKKTYTYTWLSIPNGKVYKNLAFDYNKKYIIHGIAANIKYKDNIEDCFKRKDELVAELTERFKKAKVKDHGTYKHSYDKSGKTTVTRTYFLFKSNDYVDVYCNDWSPEMFKKHRWVEDLGVSIGSSEYRTFLFEAYK